MKKLLLQLLQYISKWRFLYFRLFSVSIVNKLSKNWLLSFKCKWYNVMPYKETNWYVIHWFIWTSVLISVWISRIRSYHFLHYLDLDKYPLHCYYYNILSVVPFRPFQVSCNPDNPQDISNWTVYWIYCGRLFSCLLSNDILFNCHLAQLSLVLFLLSLGILRDWIRNSFAIKFTNQHFNS